jgi:hypothetical protein
MKFVENVKKKPQRRDGGGGGGGKVLAEEFRITPSWMPLFALFSWKWGAFYFCSNVCRSGVGISGRKRNRK